MADVNANIGVSIDTSQALAQLKNLQREISQFHSSIARSSATSAQAQRTLQQDFLNSINATGKFAAEFKTITTASESFTNSLEKNKFSMGEYFKYAGGASKTFGRLFKTEFDTINKVAEDRVKKLQTQFIKMGRDANGALKAISITPLALDMNNLSTKTMIAAQKQQLFNELISKGSTNLINWGKNTQWAGRQLMVGFTVPLTIFGTAASRIFTQIEQQALRFKRVYGDMFTSSLETQANLDAIRGLAQEFTKYGVAIEATMGLAADAAASGLQGAKLQEQVTQATRLSVLGEVDRQEAFKATISLQSAFQMSNEELADSVNFLNAVENQTVTSLADMTEAIPKVAPVIRGLGGDVKDMAVFLTAMREGGVNASEAANGLKSALASMINPSKAAKEMLRGVGVDLEALTERNKGNLMRTVLDLGDSLKSLEPLARTRVLEKLFGKFQFARVSALFDNISRSGSQAQRTLELMSMSSIDLAQIANRELTAIEENTATKFKASVESLKSAIAPVGEVFLKIAIPMIEVAKKVADWFSGLSDHSKKMVAMVVATLGVIAPAALMLVGLFANFFGQIVKFIAFVKGGFNAMTNGSKTLGEQTNYTTQAQNEALAVAASLDQVHAKLTQKFTVEAEALALLRTAYINASTAAQAFTLANPNMLIPGAKAKIKKFADGGIIMGPGTGTSDSIPAMVSNGEAIIPAKQTQKYSGLISGIIADKIPGYATSNMPQGYWTQEKRDQILDALGLSGKERVRIPYAGDTPSYSTAGVMAPASVNDSSIGMTKAFLQSPLGKAAYDANIQVGLEGLGVSSTRISEIFDEIGPTLKDAIAKFDDTTDTWSKSAQDAMDVINRNKNISTAEKEILRKRIAPINPDDYTIGSNRVLEVSRRRAVPRAERVNAPAQYGSARQLELLKKQFPDEDFSGYEFSHMPGYQSIPGQQTKVAAPSIGTGVKGVKGRALTASELSMLDQERKAYELRNIKTVDAGIDAVKKAAQTKSPSKRTIPIGQDIAKGLEVGIASREKQVKNSASRVADGAIKAMRDTGLVDKNGKPLLLPEGGAGGTGGGGGGPVDLGMPGMPPRRQGRISSIAGRMRGMSASGAMMGVTGAMFGASMLPGAVGDFAQKLIPATMALQAMAMLKGPLMSMLSNPYTAAAAGIAGIVIATKLYNDAAERGAKKLEESANRQAEALLGSVSAIKGFGKFVGTNSPSQREFARNNKSIISADQAKTLTYSNYYKSEAGQTSNNILTGAAARGQGESAAAMDIAQRAAIFNLTPQDIAANIRAAAKLTGADELQIKSKIEQMLFNGKDLTKEPLTIDARMNFLNTQTRENLNTLKTDIKNISKIDVSKGFLPAATDYQGLRKAAGAQQSINDSYSGGIGGNVMGGLKQAFRFAKNSFSDTGVFQTQDVIKDFNNVQTDIAIASTKIKVAFEQENQYLGILNSQYNDGAITQEQYNKAFAESETRIQNIIAGQKDLINQLEILDTSGKLANAAIEDLVNNALADLENSNPQLFKQIKKDIMSLPKKSRVEIAMGYANGSFTLVDIVMLKKYLDMIVTNKDGTNNYKAIISLMYDEGASKQAIAQMRKGQLEAQLAGTTDSKTRGRIQGQISKQNKIIASAREIIPGVKDVPGDGGIDPNASSASKTSWLDAIVKQMRDVNFMNQKLTEGFAKSKAALSALLKKPQSGTGLEEWLKNQGANKPLTDLIIGMSPEEFEQAKGTIFNFDKATGKLKSLTEWAKKLGAALGTMLVDGFIKNNQNMVTSVTNQQNVLTKLTSTGMSYGDALEYIGTMSPEVIAQLANTDVATDKWAELKKSIDDANASLASTPEGAYNAIKKASDKAIEMIDAQAALIQASNAAELKAKEAAVTKFQKAAEDAQKLIDPLQESIDANNHSIDLLNRSLEINFDRPLQKLAEESTILSNNLSIIDNQAKAINDQYDKQAAALELVNKANQDAIAMGKQKISIADALSSGDISAAAQAVQDLRAQQASAQSGAMQSALDQSKKSAIDGLSAGGMTKAQIEERQYQISQQSFTLEQNKKAIQTQILAIQDKNYLLEQQVYNIKTLQLDPANKALVAAQTTLKAHQDSVAEQIKTLTWQGKNKDEWILVETNAKLALLTVKNVESSVKASATAAAKLKETYKSMDGMKITTTETHYIHNIITTTYTSSGSTGGKDKDPVRKSGGGFIPQYFGTGGLARGFDSVPAMLTPGEFVVNRVAAKAYKPLLESINNATYPSMPKSSSAPATSSIVSAVTDNSQLAYNYSLSVNVNGSNVDANDIANTVMTRIKQMDSQRVRGQVKY